MKKPIARTKQESSSYPSLLTGIGALLEQSRRAVVRAANCFMTATYWDIGRRIIEFEQGGKKRAEYGEELLERLSRDLTERHGRGFGVDNLQRFRQFFLHFPAAEIYATLSRKSSPEGDATVIQTASKKSHVPKYATLSRIFHPGDWLSLLEALAQRFPLPWSHYVKLLTVKDEAARRFYEEEALRGGWSVRQLDRQIGSLFYQRTLLSKDKAAMLRKGAKPQPGDALTVDEAVRDPLVLEFLNLKDEYSETDLEDALVRHLESFLLELGSDFAFVGRQRRLRIGNVWYRVDLLFFHRRLKCLVVIDLKLGDFTHADAGQIYPVRYVLLRLRPAKHHRRKLLRRLHQRLETPCGRAQRWKGPFHRCSTTFGTRLLRGVSQSVRRHQTREISQVGVGQTLHQESPRLLSHGVNLYLNYAREHWTHPDENPPAGLILYSSADASLVRYTLDSLPSKVMAREYQLALPDTKRLEAELSATRRRLERAGRKGLSSGRDEPRWR